jgi:hypothetical protein
MGGEEEPAISHDLDLVFFFVKKFPKVDNPKFFDMIVSTKHINLNDIILATQAG